MIGFALILILAILIGLLLFKSQYHRWRMYSKVHQSDRFTVHDDEKVLPIAGRVKPHPNQKPFRKPFSDEPCVYEDWTVTHSYPHGLGGSLTSDSYSNEHSVPFIIEKNGQSIEVHPEELKSTILEWEEIPDNPVPRTDIEIGEKGTLQLSSETYSVIDLEEEVTVFGELQEVYNSNNMDYRITSTDRTLFDKLKDLFKFKPNPLSMITNQKQSKFKKAKYKNIIKMGLGLLIIATSIVMSFSLLTNDFQVLQTVSSYMVLITITLLILYPVLAVAEWIVSSALDYI